MATFIVKNILTNVPVTLFGTIVVNPRQKVDLLQFKTVDEIKSSLIGGQLYHMMIGRALSIVDVRDFSYITFTAQEKNFIEASGIMQGYEAGNKLTVPFMYDSDGNLLVYSV